MHCFKYLLLLVCLLSFAFCGKYSLSEEEETETDTEAPPASYTLMLDIQNKQNVPIHYPLSAFLFDGQNDCLSQTTIPDETSLYSQELTRGKYTLILLSGLENSDCSFPLEIITDSYFSLNANHCSNEAIQMGRIEVNLNHSTQANLKLSYIVSSINISLYAVPKEVKEVTVELSPVSSAISFNGNYINDGSSCHIECTKVNGSWQAGPIYVFPCESSKTHLTIQIQTPEGNQSYGYTYENVLQAGVPYHFTGNLTEGVQMDGSCQSEGWEDEVNEEFDFDEIYPEENPDDGNDDDDDDGNNDGNSDDNNDESDEGNNDGNDNDDENNDGYNDGNTFTVSEIPEPESIWNNVYIWKLISITPYEAEAILIAPAQWESLAAQGAGLLSAYEESGITGWRTFTSAEAKEFKSTYGGEYLTQLNLFLKDNGFQSFSAAEGRRYLCDDCSKTFSFTNNRILDAGQTVKYYLRPIKTVRFRIAQ